MCLTGAATIRGAAGGDPNRTATQYARRAAVPGNRDNSRAACGHTGQPKILIPLRLHQGLSVNDQGDRMRKNSVIGTAALGLMAALIAQSAAAANVKVTPL